ncbi:four-helix bundle copper-binding protein [Hymenobacter sp. H14-R3]|uniref:four-helix bundle copper-binding protein n=1 Tax=Hymenobacter sp. H14-R3 TaxID=3046308 RepID=UPI0024B91F02|nr:four-helix bundle copper-binding protein [Hymenobacter sp. H14-R3]MDJ0366510.1 four-helix bundle copper-binding protein [Hymenobacter sp. H14-R3]
MQAHTQSQLDALHAAVTACEHCATACLQEADVRTLTRCIALTRDCADVCALALRLVARDSAHAAPLLAAGAAICAACADACSQHAHLHCQQCAEACRRCA